MKDEQILMGDMEYICNKIPDISQFDRKTIVITGCAGFLGYYFVHFFQHIRHLGVEPHALILLDNFQLGVPKWLNEQGDANDSIIIRKFDIANGELEKIDPEKHADYVIHMASIASPTFYRKFPVQTIDANIWGLRNLLDYYKDGQLKGLLFFSSSEIYGDPLPEFIPTAESYRGNVTCIGPRACYDESKRFGETLCAVFSSEYGVPVRIVRPFNNYGPGMDLDDRRLPADFAKAVMGGEDIVIHSDGSPTRTFCYIADAIIGYLKALLHDEFDYFNIGMDEPEISVADFARIYKDNAERLLEYKGKILYQKSEDSAYLTDNPSRRCPNLDKARQILDYKPEIRVEKGVLRFLQFLMEEGFDK